MADLSPARVKANRKNAMKSTGPKTAKGKQVVRWNAMKHGLLSTEVVIRAGDGQEDPTQYGNLLAALTAQLQPVGALEEILVERIAVCYWRLARILRCEAGEIRSVVDSIGWESAFRRADDVRQHQQYMELTEDQVKLWRSSMGCQTVLDFLTSLKDELETENRLSEETRKKLIRFYGRRENPFVMHLLVLDTFLEDVLAGTNSTPSEEPLPSLDNLLKSALKVIDQEVEHCRAMQGEMATKEELETESTIMRNALPASEAADKILRYETTIERQMYRAIDQLERLQRHRKGDAVPPPINLDISTPA